MKKLPVVLALVTAVGGLGFSVAPTIAAGETSVAAACHGSNPDITKNADDYKSFLQQEGVTGIQEVNDWGGCVRAIVRGPDGRLTMAFFDADTLKQIGGPDLGLGASDNASDNTRIARAPASSY